MPISSYSRPHSILRSVLLEHFRQQRLGSSPAFLTCSLRKALFLHDSVSHLHGNQFYCSYSIIIARITKSDIVRVTVCIHYADSRIPSFSLANNMYSLQDPLHNRRPEAIHHLCLNVSFKFRYFLIDTEGLFLGKAKMSLSFTPHISQSVNTFSMVGSCLVPPSHRELLK